MALTPHQAQGCEPRGRHDGLLLGGGPVSKTLLGALLDSGRVAEVWESYGLSEALTHVATRKLAAISDSKPLHLQRDHWDQPSGCAVIHAPSRAVTPEPAIASKNCRKAFPVVGPCRRRDQFGRRVVDPGEVERA